MTARETPRPMLVHWIGIDDRYAFDWYDQTDDLVQLVPTSASFIVVDRTGNTALTYTLAGTELTTTAAHALELLIPAGAAVTAGNYVYTLSAVTDGDTYLISGGLFRVL